MLRVFISALGVLLLLPQTTVAASLSLVPEHAPAGARVLIVGSGLANANATFAGVSAPARVITRSAAALEVIVPPGAVSGPVVITDGTSTIDTVPFTVTASPAYERVVTIPASWSLKAPNHVAIALPDGRIVVADRGNHQVRISTPSGQSVLVVGTGKPGFRDGIAQTAQFSEPSGVAVDSARGLIYVADRGNHAIRRITLAGEVTTLAGSGKPEDRDGAATAAGFKQPAAVAIDDEGNIYVADSGNHKIRRVSLNGSVSTIGGTGAPGYRDGGALQSMFKGPESVAVSGGTVYVADTQNHVIRTIAENVAATVAGTTHPGFVDGNALSAEFHAPSGVAVAPDGSIYVADTRNHRIREVRGGVVRTLSGIGTPGNRDGALALAAFHEPAGLTVEGALFVADAKNNALRVAYSGVVASAFHPATAKPDGGEPLRIFGAGFVPGATEVRIDGIVTPVTYLSSTSLLVTTPPHAVGSVEITITTPGGTATLTGFRYAPLFVAISIAPNGATLDIGQTSQFAAFGIASDQSQTDLTTRVTWTSSSPATATVDAAGVVTAVTPGATTITANFENLTAAVQVMVLAPEPLPPDPAGVAPELPKTEVPSFKDATKFLYTGADPIQTGVSEGTIEEIRAGVSRGVVKAADGRPLGGVKVSVLDNPQFGETLSRADGMYDLVINGGKTYTIAFEKSGYITAHRKVYVPWQNFARTDDVVLLRLDSAATVITAASPDIQVARANAVTDSDGTRRATLVVPANITAAMTLPDGTIQPLDRLTVRATEFTVGPNGPAAMPAELPPQTGYTYCVELSADEAIEVDATTVTFNKPLAFYVENFIEMPDGVIVPSGYYDRKKSAWIPSDNGRVVRIVAINSGQADIDINGDGTADSAAALAALGIDAAERQAVAELYAAGTSLWRVPISHFTPFDHNWPWGPSDDAEAPDDEPAWGELVDNAMRCSGSIVRCENQTLGELIPITGTPFSLAYNSGRVAGRTAERKMKIKVTDETVPASLLSVVVTVDVLGKRTRRTFTAAPSQEMEFVWDGTDAYGRETSASAEAQVTIENIYEPVYYVTTEATERAFGRLPGVRLEGSRARASFTLPNTWTVPLGTATVEQVGLGGWTLSAHHLYDFTRRLLLFGDGDQRSSDPRDVQSSQVVTVGGRANGSGDGSGIATRERLDAPYQVAIGPDGTIYMDEREEIRRITPDGRLSRVAGTGVAGYSGDGGPALQAQIDSRGVISIGPDESLYIPDEDNWRVRRIKDGVITTVAGNGLEPTTNPAENVPATSVRIWPHDVAVAPDNTLYIADGLKWIRRVTPDGNFQTFAGGGTSLADGVMARDARFNSLEGLALGPDGSIYFGDERGSAGAVLRRISPDGVVRTIAGGAAHCADQLPHDGPAKDACFEKIWFLTVGGDGTIYIPDNAGLRVRTLAPDGIVRTVFGNGRSSTRTTITNGGIATGSTVNQPWGATLGPDGGLYVTDVPFGLVRRVAPVNPRFSLAETVLPSADGAMLYVFDGSRHVRTMHALTNATLYTFGYDAAGQLVTVTDIDNNVTTVERDADGKPTAIVAPGGQRTTLEISDDGYLERIANPAGEAYSFEYEEGGLLAELRTPRDKAHTFEYEADGRLKADEGPTGTALTLTRSGSGDNWSVITTTALGRLSTEARSRADDGSKQRRSTGRTGLLTTTATGADGTGTMTTPEGVKITATQQPDPRFGLHVPVVSFALEFPSGRKAAINTSRSVALSTPNDPYSMTSMTNTTTVGSRTMTTTFNVATRELTLRTPLNRTVKARVDLAGRIERLEVPGLDPVQFTYTHGSLASLTQGPRTYSLTYGAGRRLNTMADPLRSVTFAYDPAGRVASATTSGGQQSIFGYDASGNRTSVRPPGRPVHFFTFNDADQVESYVPPSVGPNSVWRYTYNGDGHISTLRRPDGSEIAFAYDASGRLEAMDGEDDATVNLTWDAAGRLQSIATPSLTGTLSYDGTLLTSLAYSGTAAGTITYDYDDALRLKSESIAGATVAFGYDNDDMLVQAGAITLTRNASNAALAGTTVGVVTDTFARNTLGEITTYAAKAGTTNLLNIVYTRESDGRIKSVTETIQGTTSTRSYTYDSAGRLASVTLNGANPVSYTYDDNGNRLTKTTGSVIEAGSVDSDDRLLTYGDAVYTYTPNGELKTRQDTSGTSTFSYDGFGLLESVTLPNGSTIRYVMDAFGRRIAREIDGTRTHAWIWDDRRIVAELDGTGSVVSRFVYASRAQVPDYMVRGGVTYRIIADYIGSPRLVVNSANGTVVHRMDYDEFGNVTMNSSPGFLPFGFAAGIYDPATRLTRLGVRDYDARAGRWTTKDPALFGGGANLYAYSYNDPLNYLDRDGKAPLPVVTGIIGGLAGGIGSAIGQVLANKGFDCFSWGDVGIAAAVGTVAGALAPVTATTWTGAALSGAAANVAQTFMTDLAHDRHSGPNEYGGTVALGLLGGIVGGSVYKGGAGFNEETLFGNRDLFRSVNTTENLRRAVGDSGRSAGSAVISSIPIDGGCSCQ